MGEAADKSADEGDEVYLLTRYASADHWRARAISGNLAVMGPTPWSFTRHWRGGGSWRLPCPSRFLKVTSRETAHITCRALERLTYYQKRSSSWCLWQTSRHGSSEQPMDLAMGVGWSSSAPSP